MAKEKEIKYTQKKLIGTIGDDTTVELGYYTVDGEAKAEKIYVFNHYTKRDGSTGSTSIAKLSVDEFNALKAMEI